MVVIPESDSRRPLDGTRVVSVAEQYPGPYAAMLLADLGADVVIRRRPNPVRSGRKRRLTAARASGTR
ncbi:MAG: hypothetical protein GEV09_14540 [Pseudonocardiaceae bacterium]|nr:hypothetical protein [Pseudonocardiaceae bacterium]